ncbi:MULTISPECIES: phosphoglycerate kinase [unclassified Devosia]|jgi:phosphoglycerate kinase|uniref:phosphoglycerate kinase n=2 Tax=Hyphomicrobiales TaxID=356 RepID=UPI00086D49AF|nr:MULTISPECIES: phosphoglycerate kinase [unclassified Devosia]MBN9363490.1 phosphoglycerate kinase [Devosia sp.]ODS95309.1 MAG: phosphoglycerate kinase [Devosia sp. SCN 66-27]OJX25304.1 MAG: phosphoglycerate kinase [Devosia sp. 66-14]
MPAFKTLDDFDLSGKRVLVRADLNVPVADGKVTDATRIERLVPTIREIIKVEGKAIILSHFGRPKGKVDPEFSLEQVVPAVADETGHPVGFIATDWTDVEKAKQAIDEAPPGSILVLENTRFHPGEEDNDPALAARMAELGDIFVNDAFSAAHRAHASTEAIAHLLPSAAGRAMEAELKALEAGLGNPERPVIAIVGGAKVSTKLDLLGNLIKKVDGLVIGGAMANTFLHAGGLGVGKSLAEKDLAETANDIRDKAEAAHCAIILPIDATVAWHFEANAPHRFYGVDSMDPEGMILDVGPGSIERIKGAIDEAKTVVWNGPLGAFEMQPFDHGTVEIAQYVAARTKAGKVVSVAGGGDTVSALAHAGVKDQFTYVSTAGGAFLEWMEGKPLPGVEALKR